MNTKTITAAYGADGTYTASQGTTTYVVSSNVSVPNTPGNVNGIKSSTKVNRTTVYSAKITWADNSLNESGFKLQRFKASSKGCVLDTNFTVAVGANVTSYTDSTASSQTCGYGVASSQQRRNLDIRNGFQPFDVVQKLQGVCTLPIGTQRKLQDGGPLCTAPSPSRTARWGCPLDGLHNPHPERIRLSGIDCPEKGQAYGKKAKQAASDLIFGKEVTIQNPGHDKYKRIIGEVILFQGMNLNQELVKQGWCWWYRKCAPGDTVLAPRSEPPAGTPTAGMRS